MRGSTCDFQKGFSIRREPVKGKPGTRGDGERRKGRRRGRESQVRVLEPEGERGKRVAKGELCQSFLFTCWCSKLG